MGLNPKTPEGQEVESERPLEGELPADRTGGLG
jgi:hypothetical protein